MSEYIKLNDTVYFTTNFYHPSSGFSIGADEAPRWLVYESGATLTLQGNMNVRAGIVGSYWGSFVASTANGFVSTRYYDIWVQNSMTTNATHDFQAWSSLTAMFARLHVTLCVTYEFNASTSTTILNSILVPINQSKGLLNGTATADQDVFDTEFWIEEPTTITMVQSAVYLSFNVTAAANTTVSVQGLEKAGGSQGTTSSLYTVANYTAQSGSESIQHRIDLAHGGTAVTLARGRNKLRLKVFAAASGSINSFSGYYIINYTSGKSAQGVGKHNHTVQWPLCTQYDGTIAGTATREVATTNQRTPNLPQTTYWLNNVFYTLEYNTSNSVGYTVIQAERLAGEGAADGWDVIDCLPFQGDGEYGHYTYITQCACPKFNRSPNETGKLNIETARKYRLHGGTGTLQSHLKIITTYHSLVFVASGDISNSAGGSIDIDLHSDVTGERIATTSRSGNGSYSFNVYDSTENLYVVARESGTLLGRSDLGLAV